MIARFVFALVLTLAALTRPAAATVSEISDVEAGELAEVAVPPSTQALPGFNFELCRGEPHVTCIELQWSNPEPGSIIIGHYEVDRRNAEVWNLMTCERQSAPVLLRLQRRIRMRHGMPTASAHHLTRPAELAGYCD